MTIDFTVQQGFIQALKVDDNNRMKDIFSEWLEKLFNNKLWDDNNQNGKMIPWMKAENAFTNMEDTFNYPGLYIFGTENNKLLYLGKAKGTLKERLRQRYFGPKKETNNKRYAQFQIARNYEQVLKDKGYIGLPENIKEWYRKYTKKDGTVVRLEHAQELARSGIYGIWFTVLPFKDKNCIELLESKMINIANDWNLEKDYPQLLNKKLKLNLKNCI